MIYIIKDTQRLTENFILLNDGPSITGYIVTEVARKHQIKYEIKVDGFLEVIYLCIY